MWRAQVEALEAAGIRAITVDLPGHGTRLGAPFTLEACMAAIDDSVRDVDGPVLLCGLSLGGYLALHYAGGVGRDSVDGVIAASCGTTPTGVKLAAYRALARGIRALPDGGAGMNQFMVDRFLPPAAREDVVRGGVALDVMADSLAAAAQTAPITAIGSIRVPLLLVNGQFDHFRLEERAYLAAARARPGIPESWSQLLVVPGANHMVSLVRPREFSAILVQSALAAGTAAW